MLMRLFRFGQRYNNTKLNFLSKLAYKVQFYLHNTSLPHTVKLGKGTRFAYGGISCVIHERAVIGENCVLGQSITIGGRSKHYDVPVIGNNVYIGAGARVLGPVHISDDVIIAANSVVISDVQSKTIVGGIPAKVLRSNINPNDFI